MLTQKQWKVQQQAMLMRSVATTAAAEAQTRFMHRQSAARDHLVVAEEMQSLSKQILDTLEQNIFGSLADNDFDALIDEMGKRSSYLALNAALVACSVSEHKVMALIADELRTISLELTGLFGKGCEAEYEDIPSAMPRSKVVSDVFYLFSATSGKVKWFENAVFVQELMMYCPEYIKGDRLIITNEWRDMDIPVIKLGDVSDNSGLVIISDALDHKKQYAVVASFGLHSLVNSHVGINKTCTADIPVRECWSASDGSDIIFLDWEKLV